MVFAGQPMPPTLSFLRYTFQAEVPRNVRVSRNRNGVELPCIKISISDWFSDIRAWIYDIILRAPKREHLEMPPGTVLPRDFIENIAKSQFCFSTRISIPIQPRNRPVSL